MQLTGSRASMQHTRGCSNSNSSSTTQRALAPRSSSTRAAAAGTTAAAARRPQPHRRHLNQQQQQQQQQQRPSWVARDAPAPALATTSVEEDAGPSVLGADAAEIIAYASHLAVTGETYEVHTWMLLLGILKDESCLAAKALVRAGLDDLYGAWHEVLWALNVSDGLDPRAFTASLAWAPGAGKVVNGAVRFAGWAGRDKVLSQDLLMAIAAAGALEQLFPDLGLTFEAVRRAVQKEAGEAYRLPDDDPADAALQSQDIF
jgi:hypothetical protein